VRISLLHHVTWSVNSVCHLIGAARSRPRQGGDFWRGDRVVRRILHNSHHADPTCARHGVLPRQIDISARLIWMFEKTGWVWEVRWPTRNDWPA